MSTVPARVVAVPGRAILIELQDLRCEMAALRARVSALEGARQRDEDSDAKLISAIAFAVGGSVFSVRDLQQHAQHVPELRAALAGAGARQIAWLLRRMRDAPTGRYRVDTIGRNSDGAVWRLVDVSAASVIHSVDGQGRGRAE